MNEKQIWPSDLNFSPRCFGNFCYFYSLKIQVGNIACITVFVFFTFTTWYQKLYEM